MGGLFLGFFTPTEAGAVGAGGAIVLGFVRRRLNFKQMVQAALESTRISCMVMVIVAGATMYGHFLAITRIPYAVATWVGELPLPHAIIMAFIILIYLIGGMFIDALGLILLTIPIFYPVVTQMGYDPIWFGVIIVLVTQMGVITSGGRERLYRQRGGKGSSATDYFQGSRALFDRPDHLLTDPDPFSADCSLSAESDALMTLS